MAYAEPTFQDANHDLPLKYEMRLPIPYESMVHRLAEAVCGRKGGRPRRDVVQATVNALDVILANLLRAHYRDPNLFIALPLRNGSYPAGPYNPFRLGIRAVRRTVHYLQDSDPPYVESMGGNNDPATGKGYYTRLRATKRLIDELEECLRHIGPPMGHPLHRALTGNAFSSKNQSILNGVLFDFAELPIIRVKSGHKDDDHPSYQPPPDTPRVREMDHNLVQYNGFLRDHWVDLLVPDTEFLALQHRSKGNPDKYFGDPGRPIELDLVFKRKLHRVFNDGTIDHGGRFYGGWWQNIPSHYRKAITINWHTTIEIDYSSMHPHMLYALEGKTAPEDSYALNGFPTEHRPLLKTTFQKLINARGRIQAPKTEELPEGWTWKQILTGMRELHEPISKHFQSGKGIELQHLDSDIAEQVMMTMMSKGLLVLPVHDSFIVWDTKADLLRNVMQDAYVAVMGRQIGMKADGAWVEENIPHEAHELHNANVYHIADTISDYSDGPEFTNYRQRRRDFLEIMGGSWAHRHSFLS